MTLLEKMANDLNMLWRKAQEAKNLDTHHKLMNSYWLSYKNYRKQIQFVAALEHVPQKSIDSNT